MKFHQFYFELFHQFYFTLFKLKKRGEGARQKLSPCRIDSYAKNKFEALKDYAEKHNEIHWGFIRAVGTQIYISNTEWDENIMNKNVWKPIEEIIR